MLMKPGNDLAKTSTASDALRFTTRDYLEDLRVLKDVSFIPSRSKSYTIQFPLWTQIQTVLLATTSPEKQSHTRLSTIMSSSTHTPSQQLTSGMAINLSEYEARLNKQESEYSQQGMAIYKEDAALQLKLFNLGSTEDAKKEVAPEDRALFKRSRMLEHLQRDLKYGRQRLELLKNRNHVFDALPAEVLQGILEHLDFHNISKMRLCARRPDQLLEDRLLQLRLEASSWLTIDTEDKESTAIARAVSRNSVFNSRPTHLRLLINEYFPHPDWVVRVLRRILPAFTSLTSLHLEGTFGGEVEHEELQTISRLIRRVESFMATERSWTELIIHSELIMEIMSTRGNQSNYRNLRSFELHFESREFLPFTTLPLMLEALYKVRDGALNLEQVTFVASPETTEDQRGVIRVIVSLFIIGNL